MNSIAYFVIIMISEARIDHLYVSCKLSSDQISMLAAQVWRRAFVLTLPVQLRSTLSSRRSRRRKEFRQLARCQMCQANTA